MVMEELLLVLDKTTILYSYYFLIVIGSFRGRVSD